MESKQKLFAFKLAAKQQKKDLTELKWKARDGVAVAGCSDYKWPGNLRYIGSGGGDDGMYC